MIALWAADLETAYGSPNLLAGLNFIFSTLASLAVAFLIGWGFLVRPVPGMLIVGCGVLIWGAGSLVAPVVGQNNSNTIVTIHNLCVWLAACGHLAGVSVSRKPRRRVAAAGLWVGAAYTVGLGLVWLVAQAVLTGWMRVLFVQGQGGTLVRQFVLGSAISMLVLTAALLRPAKGGAWSAFAYWYALALLLLAAGLFGVMIAPVSGGALSWTGRAAQFLGGAYMIVAAFASAREADVPVISLGTGQSETQLRYLVAITVVIAAAAVRLAFLPTLETRNPYITFYPAIMLTALYGGLRAGLLATVLSALVADYFWMKPVGRFGILHPSDWLAMAIFLVSCTLISWISDAMHRARSRAAEVEAQARLVEERERAEEALRESESKYRTLFENMTEEVHFWKLVRDEKGRIKTWRLVDANPPTLKTWGKTLDEIKGKTADEIFDPGATDHYMPVVQKIMTEGVPYSYEDYFPHLAKHFWFTSVPLGEYFITTGADITTHKRVEEALKEADRRKDEFLAMLAHELRNPLAPIRNAVHLLRLIGPPEPKLVQARDLIDRQVTHMVRLVDDLLDISRITRGKITLRKERVDLSAMVEQAVEIARPLITRKRHRLTLSCAPEPIAVEADPARLVQVIGNLLDNAAKFTEAGGSITLSTERRDAEALIRVRDTGRGIAPELLLPIFDVFVQGEPSVDRTAGGLGIGLALARYLVEQHGGHIEARSAGRGHGSEFIVTWPALSLVTAVADFPGGVEATGPGRRLRVLVVEDNVDVAESFIMLLEIQGHEVRAAHTGPAAIDLAVTFVPDIAFIDLGLPGIDGYEVARRFRAMPAFQATVLVALSGYGQEEDKRRAHDAGFDHHLTKPVDPSAVDALLIDVADAPGLHLVH